MLMSYFDCHTAPYYWMFALAVAKIGSKVSPAFVSMLFVHGPEVITSLSYGTTTPASVTTTLFCRSMDATFDV